MKKRNCKERTLVKFIKVFLKDQEAYYRCVCVAYADDIEHPSHHSTRVPFGLVNILSNSNRERNICLNTLLLLLLLYLSMMIELV